MKRVDQPGFVGKVNVADFGGFKGRHQGAVVGGDGVRFVVAQERSGTRRLP